MPLGMHYLLTRQEACSIGVMIMDCVNCTRTTYRHTVLQFRVPTNSSYTAECQRIETRNRRKQEQQVKEERVCGHWVKRGKEWTWI
jgi:hypothetical protein